MSDKYDDKDDKDDCLEHRIGHPCPALDSTARGSRGKLHRDNASVHRPTKYGPSLVDRGHQECLGCSKSRCIQRLEECVSREQGDRSGHRR